MKTLRITATTGTSNISVQIDNSPDESLESKEMQILLKAIEMSCRVALKEDIGDFAEALLEVRDE